jgi:hypothetical protein
MNKLYVEQRDDGNWIVGRHVPLDSVIHAYLGGQTAESIANRFPC